MENLSPNVFSDVHKLKFSPMNSQRYDTLWLYTGGFFTSAAIQDISCVWITSYLELTSCRRISHVCYIHKASPLWCLLVYSEGWLHTEGLPTSLTFIGLLPCVYSLMINEVWLHINPLPRYITFEGVLPYVSSLMHSEVWFHAERFLTFTRFISLLFSVSPLMHG